MGGTVAAALEEKKKSKGNSNTSSSNTVTIDNEHNDIAPVDEQINSKKPAECTNENDSSERHEEDMGDEVSSVNERDGIEGKEKSESRKGLTSEERVLLREKKRQRLAKEQENVDTKTSSSTSSHEKTSHPNPFDDDDENDE